MREFVFNLETPLDGTLFTALATTAAMRPAEPIGFAQTAKSKIKGE